MVLKDVLTKENRFYARQRKFRCPKIALNTSQ
jgi:hypothetical protein